MKQQRIKNERYKTLYKEEILSWGVDILLDGVSTKNMDTKSLQLFWYDYDTIEIRQWSNKYQKWLVKPPIPNTANHDKGILKKCTYYQISLSKPVFDGAENLVGTAIPMHRLVYVWFNDFIEPYNENNEKMEICHKERFLDDPVKDSHILNIFYDTAKVNRAMRKGAVNQYGKRKEKYGIEALHDTIK